MKTSFSIAVIFCFIQSLLTAQSCLPSGISFSLQSQIDNFPINYPGCKVVDGPMNIIGAGIKNLEGLAQVERVSGDFIITSCDSLVDLHGLDNLQTIGMAVRIQNNMMLENLHGLENLHAVEGDYFYISNNDPLNSVEGLSGLDSISGIFQIWSHDSLRSLHGLEQLKWIGNTVSIFKNSHLDTLVGLNGLEHVVGDLSFYENPELKDISSLNHSIVVDGNVYIYDNALLSECAVQLVCDRLIADPFSILVDNNGLGCQTEEQVSAACVTATSNPYLNNAARIFPNPGSSVITIDTDVENLQMIRVRDVAGKVVMHEMLNDKTFNINALQSGFYWLEIITDDQIMVNSLVKE